MRKVLLVFMLLLFFILVGCSKEKEPEVIKEYEVVDYQIDTFIVDGKSENYYYLVVKSRTIQAEYLVKINAPYRLDSLNEYYLKHEYPIGKILNLRASDLVGVV